MAKILIVDDDEGDRFLAKRVLKDSNHEIDEAVGFRTAMEKLKNDTYDLIISDFNYKDGNNFPGLRDWMETTRNNTRTLVMSGDDEGEAKKNAAEKGLPFIPKKYLAREQKKFVAAVDDALKAEPPSLPSSGDVYDRGPNRPPASER